MAWLTRPCGQPGLKVSRDEPVQAMEEQWQEGEREDAQRDRQRMAVYVEQAAQRIAGERNGDGPEDPAEQVEHAERLPGHHPDPPHGAGERAHEGDKAGDYSRARS